MRFSEQWLREWINPPIDTAALAQQLTMAGLEVDAIEAVAPPLPGVVVGHVVEVMPHPDADKLRVCRVAVSEGELLTIVCGAANVAPGVRVPTALVGATLPNGVTIKQAKLRGVESAGMLCSAAELGLAESAAGLLLLPTEAPLGVAITDYLQLNDVTIELGLTPNRGDCLSIAGIAREVAAIQRTTFTQAAVVPVLPQSDVQLKVILAAPHACPRYVGRVICGVNAQAITPLWLQERLRRSGLRSIHPIVDVTNYVLLELGQPMHAFDRATLHGDITVRLAAQGEKIALLDGREIALDTGALVIAAGQQVVALAGIMGGSASAVSTATQDVFLESAFFAPKALVGQARRYGLHTDSSHRFERGVSPDLARQAMERATLLIIDIAGGVPGPVVEVSDVTHLPKRPAIVLRRSRIQRLLGCDIAAAEVVTILTSLGMVVEGSSGERWQVTPPLHRFDIEIEADLIEEVARIYGYSALPSAQPVARMALRQPDPRSAHLEQIRHALLSRGYYEAITYSFVDPVAQQPFSAGVATIDLANPISADMAQMRVSLWPGLIAALQHNQNRQQGRVRLFEIGSIYSRQEGVIVEELVVAGVVCGERYPEQWALASKKVDFFDIKADVESILGLTRGRDDFIFTAEPHSALHPGQSAAITTQEQQPVGWVGALHPQLAATRGISGGLYLFQVRLDTLLAGSTPRFAEVSKFPAIRRDIALVVERGVTAAAVVSAARASAGTLLQGLQLFDLYQGEGIDSRRKSLALGLILQDTARTLKDEDVDLVIKRVLQHLESTLGATLRE